jgi:hypothetical protein
MLKALWGTASATPTGCNGACDIAGEWVPTRHDQWHNRNPGSHSFRAGMPNSKMTYDQNGKGTGWVGEFNVQVQLSALAAGQFSATSKVAALWWSAHDGNFTLHDDGVLEVRFPSNGIVEFWKLANGGESRGREMLAAAKARSGGGASGSASRHIRLVFRHFSPLSILGSKDLLWHWGLSIGDDNIYEIGGAMAVMGPDGVVATSSPLVPSVHTKLSQFHGFLDLPQTTVKSDQDIRTFSQQWVHSHPMYVLVGPNCQTYTEDLFTFLTGENLPFEKSADRMSFRGAQGPEGHPDSVWLDPRKKPC